MAYNDFLPSVGGFNPNMSLINPSDAQGLLGSALSPELKQQMMPMGMMNRDGQAPQSIVKPEQGMSGSDMMKLASMAMQGFNRGQQPIPSGNTAQIMRDQSRPQFAGYVGSPQQQMAMALRNRG